MHRSERNQRRLEKQSIWSRQAVQIQDRVRFAREEEEVGGGERSARNRNNMCPADFGRFEKEEAKKEKKEKKPRQFYSS